MKLIKTNESAVTFPIAILIIAMFFLLISYVIPYAEAKSNVETIAFTLFCVYLILETYEDITNKKLYTTKYIAIVDIIGLIAFALMCYYDFYSYDTTNDAILWERYNVITRSKIVILIVSLIRTLLKSERFEKNDFSEE